MKTIKRLHYRIYTIFAISGLLLLSSCTDEFAVDRDGADENKQTAVEGISIINGRLVFETRGVYESVLSNLSTKTDAELKIWEEEMGDFISQRTTFDLLIESDIEKSLNSPLVTRSRTFSIVEGSDGMEVVRNVDSDALATVVNNNGVFQIEGNVYYVGYNDVLEIESSPDLSVDQLVSTNWDVIPENTNVYPVIRQISPANAKVQATIHDCHDNYKNRHRGLAELWITHTGPVYSGAGARAKHQKKTFGIWFAKKADRISLIVVGIFQITVNSVTQTENINYDSGDENNESSIQWIWNECFLIECTYAASAVVRVDGREGSKNFSCVSF